MLESVEGGENLARYSFIGAEPLEVLRTGPGQPGGEMDPLDLLKTRLAKITYAEAANRLAAFDHALLRQLRYVTSFTGGSLDPGKRSLTFRVLVGDDQRTLTDDDVGPFRTAFESFVKDSGYAMRG